MNPKLLSILFLLLMFTAMAMDAVTGEENITSISGISSLESGIIRVNSIDMTIEQNGMVSVNEELVAQTGDRVAILIPGNVREILVFERSGNEIKYESVPENDKQLIAFFLEEFRGGKNEDEITIKYNTQQLTTKSGDNWAVEFSTTTTSGHTILKINFPGDTRIISMEPRDLYWTPVSDSELWVYPQVSDFHFRFEYTIGATGPIIPKDTTTTIVPTTTVPGSDIDNSLIGLTVLLIVVIITLVFIFHKKKSGKEEIDKDVEEKPKVEEGGQESQRIKESIMNMLDENEKNVVKMLEESDEEITQAYIHKSTGIPKSSLSDTMRRLEKRNIIERKREGRINWIRLKKWVFE
jgi:uncharacterized membrane protein